MTREEAKESLEKVIKIYLDNETDIDSSVLSEIALTHCESVLNMTHEQDIYEYEYPSNRLTRVGVNYGWDE